MLSKSLTELQWNQSRMPSLKGNAAYFLFFFVMDENDALTEYNKIPLGHNRTNGAVYSKIYFKVDICSAH